MREDRNVTRAEFALMFDEDQDAIARKVRAGKLPPYDFEVSRKIVGWKASTLRRHGFAIHDQPVVSQSANA